MRGNNLYYIFLYFLYRELNNVNKINRAKQLNVFKSEIFLFKFFIAYPFLECHPACSVYFFYAKKIYFLLDSLSSSKYLWGSPCV